MYFQFLIEDQSGEKLIRILMDKIVATNTDVTYDCKSFGGIGYLPKSGSAKDIKTGKLLNDLPMNLRAFSRKLQGMPAAIFVVLDNDTRNPEEFRQQLERVAQHNMIVTDHVFCLAIEEMEAWLLGDEAAILTAYPKASLRHLHAYQQDGICGTWEVLADVVYPGGYKRMKKDCCAYAQIGKLKSEWAQRIGEHMELHRNVSPSFQQFVSEVEKRIVC